MSEMKTIYETWAAAQINHALRCGLATKLCWDRAYSNRKAHGAGDSVPILKIKDLHLKVDDKYLISKEKASKPFPEL